MLIHEYYLEQILRAWERERRAEWLRSGRSDDAPRGGRRPSRWLVRLLSTTFGPGIRMRRLR